MEKMLTNDERKKLVAKIIRSIRDVFTDNVSEFSRISFDWEDEKCDDLTNVLYDGVEICRDDYYMVVLVVDFYGDAMIYSVDYLNHGYRIDRVVWRKQYKSQASYINAVLVAIEREFAKIKEEKLVDYYTAYINA